ncbi:DISARM system phospholipase D-like protein DrmC [Salinibacterium sp.]|uniref:DISARM system phospholipase D-like protein DrmC n=1 Tax=Salinibacterium sp. TaxID=1915057 RepID=UPI00286CAE0F|nr:DISARM system phospholipase D-like protein DrmC [Salinibacterium sp.]
MHVLVRLARALTPSQATGIAASLEIDGRLDFAVSALPDGSHPAVRLLSEAFSLLGDAALLAAVVRGFAAAAMKAPNPPRAVWSGPTFEGDSDHTTAAIAHLIDEATEDVFASTFSATLHSPFVDALWRAIARGVSVTVVVEATKMKDTAAALQQALSGASFLAYVAPAGEYGIQHSKVVIVDSSIALITSANFSDAAAHRNLEAGVLIRDPEFASKVRQRFTSLWANGTLIRL